ncbi:unnamed protein product, partial [Meganyctiphanes norvegica]
MASCKAKSSDNSNICGTSSPSIVRNSTASTQKAKKSDRSTSKSRKPHPKVKDPDWTPHLETKHRYLQCLRKGGIDTFRSPLISTRIPQDKNSGPFKGSSAKCSGTSGTYQKNYPVVPTFRNFQSEKLLLSDNQDAMYKHFRSIGVLEPGPEWTVK